MPMTKEEFEKLPPEEQLRLQREEYSQATPEQRQQMLAEIKDPAQREQQRRLLEQDPVPNPKPPAAPPKEDFFPRLRTVRVEYVGMRLAELKKRDDALVFAVLVLAIAGSAEQKKAALNALTLLLKAFNSESSLAQDFFSSENPEELLKLWLVNADVLTQLAQHANNADFMVSIEINSQAKSTAATDKLAVSLTEASDDCFAIFPETVWQNVKSLDPGQSVFDYQAQASQDQAQDFSLAIVFDEKKSAEIQKSLRTHYSATGVGERNKEIKSAESYGLGHRVTYHDGAELFIMPNEKGKPHLRYEAKNFDKAPERIAQISRILRAEAAFAQGLDPKSEVTIRLREDTLPPGLSLPEAAEKMGSVFNTVRLRNGTQTETFSVPTTSAQASRSSSELTKILEQKKQHTTFNDELAAALKEDRFTPAQVTLVKRYLFEPKALLALVTAAMPGQESSLAPESAALKQWIAENQGKLTSEQLAAFCKKLEQFFAKHPNVNKQQVSTVVSTAQQFTGITAAAVGLLPVVPLSYVGPLVTASAGVVITASSSFYGTKFWEGVQNAARKHTAWGQDFFGPEPKQPDDRAPLTYKECLQSAVPAQLITWAASFVPGPALVGRIVAGAVVGGARPLAEQYVKPYVPHLWQMAKYHPKTRWAATQGEALYKKVSAHPRTKAAIKGALWVEDRAGVLAERASKQAENHPMAAQALGTLAMGCFSYMSFDPESLMDLKFSFFLMTMLAMATSLGYSVYEQVKPSKSPNP